MTEMIPIKPHGFINNWLVCGPNTESFIAHVKKTDQLNYEEEMRKIVADDELESPLMNIRLNQKGLKEHPWQYYNGMENRFVEFSIFYKVLKKIELYAVCCLNAEEDMVVKSNLWTFCAIDVWLNGEKISNIKKPVYKPIHKKEMNLKLSKGTNTIFVRLQNLGVRDTRTLFGIQLKENINEIGITTPDYEVVYPVVKASQWLETVSYQKGSLSAISSPPNPIKLMMDDQDLLWVEGDKVVLNQDVQNVKLETRIKEHHLTRIIEIAENFGPSYKTPNNLELHQATIYNKIAQPTSEKYPRPFKVYYVLAKFAAGIFKSEDTVDILEDLKLVDDRTDCSDFLVIGLLRLYLTCPISSDLKNKIKQTLLNWRYWMDEDGDDGMCFWSENHAIMFYGSQLVAGELFKDDLFTASGRLGKEQHEIAQNRCCQWLDIVEKEGFEEYLSGGYMTVTAAALLNLIDFASEEISKRASGLLNHLLRQLALHTFKGVVIGPQGRVYRDVLRPYTQGVQSLIYFINPNTPVGYSMWVACFATTEYQFPEDLVVIMENDYRGSYTSGNVEINLFKTKAYTLTSVKSPRDIFKNKNASLPEGWRPDTQYYQDVKILNEKYHGTTLFQPGVYGYQQHMWYAALDNDCVVFCNHPGGTHEFSSMRPGYWYGNGIFPMITQQNNVLGVVYQLGAQHPVDFTHIYWPTHNFTESFVYDHWLFARKGNAYIAVWCSSLLHKHDEVLFDCEYRAYDDKVAYVCTCSHHDESGSFEDFQGQMMQKTPVFDEKKMALMITPEFNMAYKKYTNNSQYIY